MVPIALITKPVSRDDLRKHMLNDELVKAVVDLEKKIMAVGGEMHADEVQVLLDAGSQQSHPWGINLYLDDDTDDWIEFDSMINVRPRDGNRSSDVEGSNSEMLSTVLFPGWFYDHVTCSSYI